MTGLDQQVVELIDAYVDKRLVIPWALGDGLWCQFHLYD